MFHILRALLYLFLFSCSAVLLGLTGSRINYTESLANGDQLTSSSHFYDPVVVALLVSASLGIIFSIWFLAIILIKIGGPLGKYCAELLALGILFVMFLIPAAVATHKWHHLGSCSSHHFCKILQALLGFAWICFGFVTFLLIASVMNMFSNKHGLGGPAHGRRDVAGAIPQTQEVHNAPVHNNPVHPAPVTATTGQHVTADTSHVTTTAHHPTQKVATGTTTGHYPTQGVPTTTQPATYPSVTTPVQPTYQPVGPGPGLTTIHTPASPTGAAIV